MRIRQPAVAKKMYPESAEVLHKSVLKFIEKAPFVESEGSLVACIAPHGPYGYSGEVAGSVFRQIERGRFDRVIILSPSHFAKFPGCSIASVNAYRTPLGDVLLDEEAINILNRCTLISRRAVAPGGVKPRTGVHENEYGIEVLLPFLQSRIGFFKLVPVLVGEFETVDGKFDKHSLNKIADAIKEIIDDRTLIIVSSDLTHYGNIFSYRPFEEKVLETIQDLDEQAMTLILKRDHMGFNSYLDKTENPICGKYAIQIMLRLLPPKTEGIRLSYDSSGAKTNNTSVSVSYAGIAFYDLEKPPMPSIQPTIQLPPDPPQLQDDNNTAQSKN